MHPSTLGSFIVIKMMSKKLHGLEESCLSSQYVDLANVTTQPHYFLRVSMLKLILSTKTLSRTYIRRAWCEHGPLPNHIRSATLVSWPRPVVSMPREACSSYSLTKLGRLN